MAQDKQTNTSEDVEQKIDSLWERAKREMEMTTGSRVDVAEYAGVPAHWMLPTTKV